MLNVLYMLCIGEGSGQGGGAISLVPAGGKIRFHHLLYMVCYCHLHVFKLSMFNTYTFYYLLYYILIFCVEGADFSERGGGSFRSNPMLSD